MSRVCEKHEEFCPEDVCRWCEPVENIEHVEVESPTVSYKPSATIFRSCKCAQFTVGANPAYHYDDAAGVRHTAVSCYQRAALLNAGVQP